ncbi:MAG: hypothetical protein U1E62_05210 [Alsobacter sp.]
MTTFLVITLVLSLSLNGVQALALRAPLCDENERPLRRAKPPASEHVAEAPL